MKYILSLLCLFATTAVAGSASTQIDAILKMPQAPSGVVFEIVTHKDDGLDWALPLTKMAIFM